MKKNNTFQTLLFLVLVIIILTARFCSSDKNAKLVTPLTITETLISYDTIRDTISKYIPEWKTKTEIKIDTFNTPIDTLAILKDYYTKYFYTDTIAVDTIGYLVVNDSISRNRIFSRNVKTNILVPVKTIKTTTYINQRELYMGLKVQGSSDQLNYVGGELLFKTKKQQVYSIGMGLNNKLEPIVSGGIYFKIGK